MSFLRKVPKIHWFWRLTCWISGVFKQTLPNKKMFVGCAMTACPYLKMFDEIRRVHPLFDVCSVCHPVKWTITPTVSIATQLPHAQYNFLKQLCLVVMLPTCLCVLQFNCELIKLASLVLTYCPNQQFDRDAMGWLLQSVLHFSSQPTASWILIQFHYKRAM